MAIYRTIKHFLKGKFIGNRSGHPAGTGSSTGQPEPVEEDPHLRESLRERYLTLLKKSLLDELYLENEARIAYFVAHATLRVFPPLDQAIHEFLNIRRHAFFSTIEAGRQSGATIRFWKSEQPGSLARDHSGNLIEEAKGANFAHTAHTMIGRRRLDNIHLCLDTIVQDSVPGDFIETGVWKGGATIFMRGYLAAHDIGDRVVWVADSFEGLPPPTHEKDSGLNYSKNAFPYLCVGIEEVQELFRRYDLLDEQVRFLKGWFRDTLPDAPIRQLALLRMDGDLYESTMDALNSLYFRLAPGGFVIVDDYNTFSQCREAVQEFRSRNKVLDEIIPVDSECVYWRRSR